MKWQGENVALSFSFRFLTLRVKLCCPWLYDKLWYHMQNKSANLQLGNTGCQKATPVYKQKANYSKLRSVHKKIKARIWLGSLLHWRSWTDFPRMRALGCNGQDVTLLWDRAFKVSLCGHRTMLPGIVQLFPPTPVHSAASRPSALVAMRL